MNESIWSVVANIKRERRYGHGGEEVRSGTRLFRGGTKVYIAGCYAGMCDSLVCIGPHRLSRRFITCVVSVIHVENFRPKQVYRPRVIELIRSDPRCRIQTKHEAEMWAAAFPEWQKAWEEPSE